MPSFSKTHYTLEHLIDLIVDELLVADKLLSDINLPGTKHISLSEGQGLVDVAQLAYDQELMFLGVKILVIITGFAEVEANHPAIISSVLTAMAKNQANFD